MGKVLKLYSTAGDGATCIAQPSAVTDIRPVIVTIGTYPSNAPQATCYSPIDAPHLHTVVSVPVGGKFSTLYLTAGDMATHVAQPSAVMYMYIQTFIINNGYLFD